MTPEVPSRNVFRNHPHASLQTSKETPMFERTKTALQAPVQIRQNSELAVMLLVGIAALSLATFIAVLATRSSHAN
jgi:hypothetical protein